VRAGLPGQASPDALLELAADGTWIAMTPTGGETGSRNGEILDPLRRVCRCQPDGSVLSPDLSLLRRELWLALTPEQRRGFPPLCPDLVIELGSPSDEGPRGVTALRRKMDLYQANGACLGWLLLPHERAVEIWREGQQGMAERLDNASRLDGGELAEGLAVELEEIWAV